MKKKAVNEGISPLPCALISSKISDGLFLTDSKDRIILWNKSMSSITGITQKKAQGKTPKQLFGVKCPLVKNYMLAGKTCRAVEFNDIKLMASEDGPMISGWVMPNKKEKGKDGMIVILDEKTRIQRLADQVVNAQSSLDGIINKISDPFFVKDRSHRWVILNDALCNFMGYSRERLLGKTDYEFFPKSEADVFWEKDDKVFSTGKENLNEEFFTTKSGKTRIISTKKSLYVAPNGERYIVGVIRDITERKTLEKQLKKLSQKLESKVRERTESLRKSNAELKKTVKRLRQAEKTVKTKNERLNKSNKKLLSLNESLKTTKKQLELSKSHLAESGRKYENLFESIPVGVIQAGKAGTLEYCNKAVQAITGYSPKELSATKAPGLPFLTPESKKALGDYMRRRGHPKRKDNLILELHHKKGMLKKAHAIVRPMPSPGGQNHTLIMLADVTEKMAAEKALDAERNLLETILKTAPTGVGLLIKRQFIWVNQRMLQMTGYSQSKLIGKSARILYPDKAEFDRVGREKYPQLIKTGTGVIETKWKRKDGKIIDVLLTSSSLKPKNPGEGVIFTAVDITAQKATQIMLESSVAEKEILLMEIHHRIKNNMQIISSMLNMSERASMDTETKKALKDCQGRIKSMALVHESLYQSESLEAIKLSSYARALVKAISSSMLSAQSNISIKTRFPKAHVDVDSALSIGLIINELLTNSIKHCEPSTEKTTVTAQATLGKAGFLLLRVCQTPCPVGLSRIDPDNDGAIGLRLVKAIAEKTGGELSMQAGDSLSFNVSFKPGKLTLL
jgi:PAS domain S-box-containing protein